MSEKKRDCPDRKTQLTPTNRWQQYILTLPGIKTGYGKLVMLSVAPGKVRVLPIAETLPAPADPSVMSRHFAWLAHTSGL